MKKLTDIQKRRLASAMQEALSKRQSFYTARITDAPERVLEKLSGEMNAADDRFLKLLNARGLCVGDVVRILVDGPYKGVEVRIDEVSWDGCRFEVRIPSGTTVVPLAHEVELVDAKTGR